MVVQADVDFILRVLSDRVGNEYVYGGTWSPTDLKQGCDCSGLVTDMLSGVLHGTGMAWSREGISTESYRYLPLGAQTVGGVFDLVHVASPGEIPADAVVKIALHHEGAGGPDSHMWCEVAGVRGESNGTDGCVSGADARAIDDSYGNDWWYLGGEIVVPVMGLDYAGGRPSGAAIKAAGYSFVVRYLSDGGSSLPGKQLLPSEADDLRANGLGIVANWETTAERMLDGFQAGVDDAHSALAQATLCGMPAGRPIYFSADWDATPEQQVAINAYLSGAGTVLGVECVGIYGGFWPVSRALDAGVARWDWQTPAWSGTNVEQRSAMQQRIGTVVIGGVQCDENVALVADFGQWNFTAQGGGFLDALTAEQQQAMYNEVMKLGPSRSFLASDGNMVDTELGFDYNIDANVWNITNTWAYLFGVPSAVASVELVAAGGPVPSSWAAGVPAVAQFGQAYCQGLVEFKTKMFAAPVVSSGQSVAPVDALHIPSINDIVTNPVAAVTDVVSGAVTDVTNAVVDAGTAVVPGLGPVLGPILHPIVNDVIPAVVNAINNNAAPVSGSVPAVAPSGSSADLLAELTEAVAIIGKFVAVLNKVSALLPAKWKGPLALIAKATAFAEDVLSK